MQTQHVEYHHSVQTGIDSDGHVSHSNEAEVDGRSWQGPWIGQPQTIRP
jgi:hypothetical protein